MTKRSKIVIEIESDYVALAIQAVRLVKSALEASGKVMEVKVKVED